MEITYESEKERLEKVVENYIGTYEYETLEMSYSAYCGLDEENKYRIISIDKKVQLQEENKFAKKDEIVLYAAYFLKNEKEFSENLSNDALILYSAYYLGSAIKNSNLGKDKEELLETACQMKPDLDSRILIMQLGDYLVEDKKKGLNSISNVCSYIKNMKEKEMYTMVSDYSHKFLNSKSVEKMARRVGL